MARAKYILAAALTTLVVGCAPDDLFELTAPTPVVLLPRDEAPKQFSGGEWWYYTGRVTDEEGRAYGIQAVIFHVPRLPYLANVAQAWIAHFAVLDETTGRFIYEQDVVLDQPISETQPKVGFDLATPLVQLSGLDGSDRISAASPDGSLAIDLELRDKRGPILHGDGGYVPFGTSGRAFYYSRPAMQAAGTLTIDGRPRQVTGEFWFDRQWGLQVANPWAKWDWFSLRLDDGTRIMLFVFRDPLAPVWFGTYIPPTGDPLTLGPGDFNITPTATWTSPHTSRTYPVAWRVDFPAQELELTVTASADDQELNVVSSTFNVYWEGLCRISGTRASQPVTGHAYVELTNYP